MDTHFTNIYRLVLSTNISPTNMQNPYGGNVQYGTVMFYSRANCTKYYQQNMQKWSNCITF